MIIMANKFPLTYLLRFVLLGILCFKGPFVSAKNKELILKCETNKMVEITLRSNRTYADPFNEVTLDAVFTSPAGKELKVPGFWAGGNIWKLRYASSLTGDHHFRTVCSMKDDKGLDGITGKIIIRKYEGDNLLFQHGSIKIAADKRHFIYADGKPFFLAGRYLVDGIDKKVTMAGRCKHFSRRQNSKRI